MYLAVSKIVYFALLTNTPNIIIDELEKTHKNGLFGIHQKSLFSTPEITQETLCMDYKNGGLKNVDIRMKTGSLQCSWIKRPYDSNFHVCLHVSIVPKKLFLQNLW